ncbi:hypothetical protein M8818_000713 [Zalaria obscura]|uniref:Uncharacterized protein n=1 Tax=Zalaria obscura TaxID=2024903 RepID=A0ACC3SMH2_9PEZI
MRYECDLENTAGRCTRCTQRGATYNQDTPRNTAKAGQGKVMTKEDRAAARERIRNIKLLIAFLGLLLATPAPRLPDPANY